MRIATTFASLASSLRRPAGLALLLAACRQLFAAADIAVVAAGYGAPTPFFVAPGQVVTLFAHGLTSAPRSLAAGTVPLPTVLAGISVTLRYSVSPESVPVPILRIASVGGLTAITIQMPFELKLPPPLPTPDPNGAPLLIVSENGVAGTPIEFRAVTTNVHVLSPCDQSPIQSDFAYHRDVPCIFNIVTHPDGSPVFPTTPARVGETVAAYAFGLGNTNAGVKTGAATPAGSALTDLAGVFRVCFEFAGARPAPSCTSPSYAGLTAGFVGLYQVNFAIPDLPEATPDCGPGDPTPNLTATIVAEPRSSDQARLCVQR